MAQYVDKSALVTEIEKRLNYRVESLKAINDGTYWKEGQSEDEFNKSLTRCAFNAAKNELFELKCLLDTLEVKDVKEVPASEDLGEYINELSKQFPEVSFAKLSRIAVRAANWQKKQMTKDAFECEVKEDAGGYPYIPQIELYDYDKDEPLAKAGDKVKIIIMTKNMSKAKKFIEDCTRNCSNVSKGYRSKGISIPPYCHPWLTPDQALRAVEIAKEEMIENAEKWLRENKDHPFIGCEDPCLSGYLTDEFIEEFKKAME